MLYLSGVLLWICEGDYTLLLFYDEKYLISNSEKHVLPAFRVYRKESRLVTPLRYHEPKILKINICNFVQYVFDITSFEIRSIHLLIATSFTQLNFTPLILLYKERSK